MRSILVIWAVVAGFVAAFATLHSLAAPPPIEPGMMPYTPSRLEWLALELEASYRQDFSRDSDQDVHYLAKPPNTILIFVHDRNEASAGNRGYGNQYCKATGEPRCFHSWLVVLGQG